MAAPRSRTHIHPALEDEVIDYLKDDPKTLAACSLVCKAWVRRSYHRFKKLPLSSTSFRRIIPFGQNNTLPYMHMLLIIGDWSTKPEMLHVLAILRTHSAPPTLILESANLTTTNAWESITTLLLISTVDTLRLSNCHVHKSTMMFDILSTLPKLNRLLLHHVKFMGQVGDPAPSSQQYTLPEPPQLSTIEVASNTLAPYLEPLELVSSQLKLNSLNLGILHVPEAHREGKFVETCTSLRDFTMTVVFLLSDFAMLGLPVLINLQSLHFIMGSTRPSTLLTFTSYLLWNLPSVHMQSITLKFLPIYDTDKKSVLKPSKRPPALPLLKKLEMAFNFDSEVDHGWVTGLLTKHFSSYCKRGILQVKIQG